MLPGAFLQALVDVGAVQHDTSSRCRAQQPHGLLANGLAIVVPVEASCPSGECAEQTFTQGLFVRRRHGHHGQQVDTPASPP